MIRPVKIKKRTLTRRGGSLSSASAVTAVDGDARLLHSASASARQFQAS